MIGAFCLGLGFGVVLAGIIWWGAGYKEGYRDGIADSYLLMGADDVTYG